ncbi:MAG: class I SAM-dependent methyltransferase [Pseudomonadota bacterium]
MTDSQHGGWTESAQAWIASQGELGDQGRRYVMDPAINEFLSHHTFTRALDVGCGEGRFCRLLSERGIHTTGIDPIEDLIDLAIARHRDGEYLLGVAQDLPFADEQFDLVVSYLTLIDIPDYRAGIAEMARVLSRNGTLLVANLAPHMSAGMRHGWQYDDDGKPKHFGIDDYSHEWVAWMEWADIRVQNWHRPLSAYIQAFLSHGLQLTHYDEPAPIEGYEDLYEKNARAPWFNLMIWRKP